MLSYRKKAIRFLAGGDWGVRVSSVASPQAAQKQGESPAEETEEQRVSFLFYISDVQVCQSEDTFNSALSANYCGLRIDPCK